MNNLQQKLPYCISRFLGYRKPGYVQKPIPQWRVWFWTFLASWLGIALLEIIFTYSKSFTDHNSPIIIASFGAAAVLLYGVPDVPLAQPRNAFFGQVIGSLTGVIISQLFLGIKKDWPSEGQYNAVRWVSGATAMAISLTIMQITKCVHPPGGATALIPSVTPNVLALKWFYIAIVVVSVVVQISVACLVNNVERKYPQYWWAPNQLPVKVSLQTTQTLMSTTNTRRSSRGSVVADNLNKAEEGRLQVPKRNNTNDQDDDELSFETTADNEEMTEKNQNDDSDHLKAAPVRDMSTTSSSPTLTAHDSSTHPPVSIDQAISTLTHNSNSEFNSKKFILLSPGLPLIATPGLLSDSDKSTLEEILKKLQKH